MFFQSRKEYSSPKNGTIIVDKFLWYTSIIVNECLEAGTYLIDMWKDALKKLPTSYIPKNVLILGLGGGNTIRLLQRKYPDVHITVVEWDEVMIDIAKQLQLFSLTSRVKISHKDAQEALAVMGEKFDVIFVDLFTGPVPPPFLGEMSTVQNLQRLLKDNGYIFLNVYKHTHYLKTFAEHLATEKTWKFRLNHLGLFKAKGKGTQDWIPSDFQDIRQSKEYLKGLFQQGEIVGSAGSLGVRHAFGYVAVEYYTTDTEPKISPFKGLRLIIWDRVRSGSVPKKWHVMLAGLSLSTVAISDLSAPEYWKEWSSTARRYRLQWNEQETYVIVPVDLETFTSYYMKLGRPANTRKAVMESLAYRMKVNKEVTELFALQEISTGRLYAGLAVINAKDVSQAYYLFGFFDKEHGPAQAGVWLMSEWFARLREKNIRFANFGPVWTPGQNKTWKGFTEFKLHFRPFLLTYQLPLFRFTFSWKDSPKDEKVQE